ncbi:G-protein coupled receptor Mth2, partial [Stegodyphus mimosarum]
MSKRLILIYAVIQLSMALTVNEDNSLNRSVIRSTTNFSQYIHIDSRHLPTEESEVNLCRNDVSTETLIPIETKYHKRSASIRNFITTTTASSVSEIDLSRFSEEFLNCTHSMVEPECYEILANGSVYVPLYFRIFNTTDYVIGEDRILFICPNFFPTIVVKPKFTSGLELVTVIGLAISAVFIVLHIIMFIFLKKLRNLPGYCLLSLCVALLMAYTGSFLQYSLGGRIECTWIGMIMFYFYLASFFWMNVMSYDVWRSLRMATSKLRLMTDKPKVVRFALYSTFSWGTPLLILFIAFIVDRTTERPEYKLIFTEECWFRYKHALSVYFALPFLILLFLNIMFYISSFCMISSSSMKTAENKSDLWFHFLVSMRLAVAMGLMWIFAVIAVATEATFLWYFYAICGSLQGVFIFFSFTFTEKTRKECKKTIQKKKSSVSRTQTSSQF